MIEIRTQEMFDSTVVNTPTTDMIRIYPKEDGKPYTLSSPWILASNTYIQGISNPKIQFTGNIASGTTRGVIEIRGTSSVPKMIVRIKGLYIIGKSTAAGLLHGIYAEYCGIAQIPYYGYDSSTVGQTKINKIGIKIENCIIEELNGSGIQLDNSSNSMIISNTIQHSLNNYGIHLNFSNNNVIKSNVIQYNDESGIYLVESHINLITENTIQYNFVGFEMDESLNNTIINNTVQNNRYYGINLWYSNNTNISNNTVQYNGTLGIFLQQNCCNNVIAGNIVKDNRHRGIFLTNGSFENSITGNIVSNNDGLGITLESTKRNTISCNTIQSNLNIGVYIDYVSEHNIFYSNISMENSAGQYVSDGGFGNLDSTAYNFIDES